MARRPFKKRSGLCERAKNERSRSELRSAKTIKTAKCNPTDRRPTLHRRREGEGEGVSTCPTANAMPLLKVRGGGGGGVGLLRAACGTRVFSLSLSLSLLPEPYLVMLCKTALVVGRSRDQVGRSVGGGWVEYILGSEAFFKRPRDDVGYRGRDGTALKWSLRTLANSTYSTG